MISFRQILVIVLVTAGIWLIKHLHTRFNKNFDKSRDELSASTAGYQDMVPCKRCGTHILRAHASGNDKEGFVCNDIQCINGSKL
jgi:hypothetical protein